MKTLIFTLFILASTMVHSQSEKDLIVLTNLDSIYCKLKKPSDLQINYKVADESLSVEKANVYYTLGYSWKRPKYYNRTLVDSNSIMLNDDKAQNPNQTTDSQMFSQDAWRVKAGSRLKRSGALLVVSVALSGIGVLISGDDRPEIAYGMFAASGVCFVVSSGMLFSAGSAIMGEN